MPYISFNCKYYKHSERNEINHVDRTHKVVESSNPKYTHRNFGDINLIDKYNEVYKKVESIKGKKIQKNSNTFIDGVLSFDRDQVNKLRAELGQEKFNEAMDKKIHEYMNLLKEKFGFEPVGYHFHGDEGHEKNGVWLENYHAQIIMFNFDFKTKTAPLRKMQRKKHNPLFSLMQDLAGAAFAPLGFERGVSKEITNAEHLEKDEFIAKKQAESMDKINQLNKDIIKYKNKLKKVEIEAENEIESYRSILKDTKNLIELSTDQDKKMKVITNAYTYAERVFLKNPAVSSFIKKIYDKIPQDVQKKVENAIDLLRVESGGEPAFNRVDKVLTAGDKIKALSDLSKKINSLDLKKPDKGSTFKYK